MKVRRRGFIAAAVVVGGLAAAHLLFAVTNFGLAANDDPLVTAPLGEGLLAVVAGAALIAASMFLLRRRVFAASVVAFCGTAPLPLFFAFTVPEHSDPIFLVISLVLPLLFGATAVVVRSRRESPGTY